MGQTCCSGSQPDADQPMLFPLTIQRADAASRPQEMERHAVVVGWQRAPASRSFFTGPRLSLSLCGGQCGMVWPRSGGPRWVPRGRCATVKTRTTGLLAGAFSTLLSLSVSQSPVTAPFLEAPESGDGPIPAPARPRGQPSSLLCSYRQPSLIR